VVAAWIFEPEAGAEVEVEVEAEIEAEMVAAVDVIAMVRELERQQGHMTAPA